MRAPSRFLAALTILSSFALAAPARAEEAPSAVQGNSEKRIALVVGNAAYQAGALATPANDAGLVAQTLQAAGFDVVGARDLDEDALRRAMRDFTDKAAASGPDTVALVYLAGYGLQLNGENYFAPVDAGIAAAADVPVQSLRISDYKRRLASLPLKARFIILDAARNNPFVKSGDPLAGGLALTEAEPGSLVAFNAAPGTVGPEEKGPYGAYAQALVEMIREGGLAPDPLFEKVRLRVSETTQGAEVPWHAAKIEAPFVFLQRSAEAPPIAEPEKIAALEARPLREQGPKEAYATSLKRDTLQGYQDFVQAYPKEPISKRVRALIAARREAVTWRRTFAADNADAYWSYLSRYPRGPHAWDCRRRLRELSVALEPPPRFSALDYDVPPPPPEEVVYVERPVVYFADPVYDLPPPPPPPVFFLPPPPAYIVDLAPPPPVYDEYALPSPAFVPVPVYLNAPVYVAPPPNNVYYQNIHNVTVINRINRENADYSARRREDGPGVSGRAAAIGAGAVAGAALGAAAARVALPPALAQRSALQVNPLSGGGRPGLNPQQRPGGPGFQGNPPNGQPNALQPNPQANRPGATNPGMANQPGATAARPAIGQPLPGQGNARPLPQANRPGTAGPPSARDGRPDDKADPRQANRPDRNDKSDPREANRPDRNDKLDPGQLRRGEDAAAAKQANRPDPADKALPSRGRPGQDAQDQKVQDRKEQDRKEQANKPDAPGRVRPGDTDDRLKQPGRPDNPVQARLPHAKPLDDRAGPNGRLPQGAGPDRAQPGAAPLNAAQQRREAAEQRRQEMQAQKAERLQAVQQQRQQPLQGGQADRQAAAQAQRQQAAQQQQRAAAQQQQQAAQAQRQQAAQATQQQRAMAQQQAAQAQRQQMAQQQRQMMQQQQMAQRQQMQQQAQQQRQMMMQQQQAQQRQMMMQAQRQPPPQQQRQPPHGGGRPGMPFR